MDVETLRSILQNVNNPAERSESGKTLICKKWKFEKLGPTNKIIMIIIMITIIILRISIIIMIIITIMRMIIIMRIIIIIIIIITPK